MTEDAQEELLAVLRKLTKAVKKLTKRVEELENASKEEQNPNGPGTVTLPIQPLPDFDSETYTGGSTGCLFDSLPPEERKKPQFLSCPCPKCSPRC